MKIGIVVLNWNQKHYTIKCLKSIRKLNKCVHMVDVYLVDNASTECEPHIFKKLFPEINLIVNQSNLGFAGGNNVGIKKALLDKSEAVMLLNNDTIVTSSLIKVLCNTFDSSVNIGIVVPKILFLKSKNRIQYAGGKFNMYTGSIKHIGFNEVDHGQYNYIKEVDFCTGAALLIKSSVFRDIGFFNEDYFLYAEDAEFSCRAIKNGYRIYYNGLAHIYHDESPSSGGYLNSFAFYLSKRNLFFLISEHGTSLQKKIFFTYSLTYFLISVFAYSLIKNKNIVLFKTYIKALAAFLKKEKGKPRKTKL